MTPKSILTSTRFASVAEMIGIHASEFDTFFVCEAWSAELATGLLTLGPETGALHGVGRTRCGIMDLIRFYDPIDWHKVLQALEEAATISTALRFATTIRPAPGLHRPVFCFGQSDTVDGRGGSIHGTFAVARLCVELGPERLN
jgi:hypothetical protein